MSSADPLFASRCCELCAAGIEHCHGTAIAHRRGGIECSDHPECAVPEEAHAHLVSCVELVDRCC